MRLKAVLGGEAGVHEVAFDLVPFFETAVVEQFQIILDDERDNIMLQALLKEDQTAYTAISILEGMDALKGYVEGYDVLKGLRGQCIIVCQQFANLIGNIFGERRIITTYLVRQLLVLPYRKPILAAVAGAGLRHIIHHKNIPTRKIRQS